MEEVDRETLDGCCEWDSSGTADRCAEMDSWGASLLGAPLLIDSALWLVSRATLSY